MKAWQKFNRDNPDWDLGPLGMSVFFLVIGLMVGATFLFPPEAHCAYCPPNIKCVGKFVCGPDCVCLKEAGEQLGRCVSFD